MPTDTVAARARARLTDEMRRKALSTRDVADLLKWSQSRVVKLLGGRVKLGVDDLAALCFAVGIAPTEAVRDHGLEFCAEMQPSELRLLESIRAAPPDKRNALLVLFDVRPTGGALPDRHAGRLPGKVSGRRAARSAL